MNHYWFKCKIVALPALLDVVQLGDFDVATLNGTPGGLATSLAGCLDYLSSPALN